MTIYSFYISGSATIQSLDVQSDGLSENLAENGCENALHPSENRTVCIAERSSQLQSAGFQSFSSISMERQIPNRRNTLSDIPSNTLGNSSNHTRTMVATAVRRSSLASNLYEGKIA